MKAKRKSFITFIELLISMTLTALILTTLFYFYRDIDWLNQDMNKTQREAFRISYLQNRLSDILPNAISPRTADKDFYFFVSHETDGLIKPNNPSLVFTYDFGANRDQKFASTVLGRLYLDTNNNLSLATLPPPKTWTPASIVKMKQEILAENVESLDFSFYVPPEKDRSKAGNNATKGMYGGKAKLQTQDVQPKDAWHADWKSEYNQLPALIKINLKFKNVDKPMTFIYPLPLSDYVIVYDK